MNGWTPSTPLKTRLENLAAQIPQENRADAFAQCMQDNPHDLERFLTAYVMTGRDDAPHPVDEAQEIERKIDEYLPPLVIISGGEVSEVAPYHGAILTDEEDMPF